MGDAALSAHSPSPHLTTVGGGGHGSRGVAADAEAVAELRAAAAQLLQQRCERLLLVTPAQRQPLRHQIPSPHGGGGMGGGCPPARPGSGCPPYGEGGGGWEPPSVRLRDPWMGGVTLGLTHKDMGWRDPWGGSAMVEGAVGHGGGIKGRGGPMGEGGGHLMWADPGVGGVGGVTSGGVLGHGGGFPWSSGMEGCQAYGRRGGGEVTHSRGSSGVGGPGMGGGLAQGGGSQLGGG